MAEDPSWARLRAKLTKIKINMSNILPANRKVGVILMRSIMRNFRVGGRPDKWKPSQRAILTGGTTLVKSGQLKRSINPSATRESVIIGTNIEYARKHHYGIGVIARPFMVIQEEDDVEILEIYSNHIGLLK